MRCLWRVQLCVCVCLCGCVFSIVPSPLLGVFHFAIAFVGESTRACIPSAGAPSFYSMGKACALGVARQCEHPSALVRVARVAASHVSSERKCACKGICWRSRASLSARCRAARWACAPDLSLAVAELRGGRACLARACWRWGCCV